MAGLIFWKKQAVTAVTPDANHVLVGVDAADNNLYVKDSTGTVTKFPSFSNIVSAVLTGFSTATGSSVVSTDTIIVAIGKLQNQSTALAQSVAALPSTLADTITAVSNSFNASLATKANLDGGNTFTGNQIVRAGQLVSDVAGDALDSSAIMEMSSTTKGYLPPRMTTAQRNAIVNPTIGLIVYDTTVGAEFIFSASSIGNYWARVPISRSVSAVVNAGNAQALSTFAIGGLQMRLSQNGTNANMQFRSDSANTLNVSALLVERNAAGGFTGATVGWFTTTLAANTGAWTDLGAAGLAFNETHNIEIISSVDNTVWTIIARNLGDAFYRISAEAR